MKVKGCSGCKWCGVATWSFEGYEFVICYHPENAKSTWCENKGKYITIPTSTNKTQDYPKEDHNCKYRKQMNLLDVLLFFFTPMGRFPGRVNR